MSQLTASAVASAAGGRLVGDDAVATGLVADSREVRPGVAFAAIGGGDAFIEEAIANGSPFVVATHDTSGRSPAVVVDDVVGALMRLAGVVRSELDARAIAITGSTGKTLTRDFVAAALEGTYPVHRTSKNYNAEIGVPLTLFAAPPEARVLVIELGARHVGEIAELCDIVRPDTGVITGIGLAHIDEFGSREQIARTKAELLASLPADGLAIVPSDDDYLDLLASSTAASVRTVGPGGHVRYRADRISTDARTHGRVWIGSEEVDVVLPVAGRALMRNAAFAIAVADSFDVAPPVAADRIAGAELTSWRMEVVRCGDRTVVNDAYNSNPTSLASSLRAGRELAAGRPAWAVLGQMAELGTAADAEHRRGGRLAAELGYAGVIVVGVEAGAIAEGAGSIGLCVGSLAEAVGAIRERVPPDAVVVVKASRVAGLERLVDELEQVSSRGPERVN